MNCLNRRVMVKDVDSRYGQRDQRVALPRHARGRAYRLLGSAHLLGSAFMLLGALVPLSCNASKPTSPPATLTVLRKRPPAKPGESITETQMCTCIACEPASCCRELEQDAPETNKECANGYDFSKCEMAVSSCDSRCFKHRWRTRVEKGCQATRPDKCCHTTSAF